MLNEYGEYPLIGLHHKVLLELNTDCPVQIKLNRDFPVQFQKMALVT